MTKTRTELNLFPKQIKPRQFLGSSLIVISGLLIFLIIGLLAPKSSVLVNAGLEYDTQSVAVPLTSTDAPYGISNTPQYSVSRIKTTPVNLDLTRGFILSDQYQRISNQFQVPQKLKKETALWFDLFTKYNKETWIIIRAGNNPALIEEWTTTKLIRTMIDEPTEKNMIQFLHKRITNLQKLNSSPLILQRGLREDFIEARVKLKKWLPAIERVFNSQKIPNEFSRFFIIPKNLGAENSNPPWTSLNKTIVNRFLIQTKFINEAKAPLKMARVLATILKKKGHKDIIFNNFFENQINLNAAFYAALFADSYSKELEIENEELQHQLQLKAFRLSRDTSISELVFQLKIKLPIFYDSNPDLLIKKSQVLLPKAYVFFVAK